MTVHHFCSDTKYFLWILWSSNSLPTFVSTSGKTFEMCPRDNILQARPLKCALRQYTSGKAFEMCPETLMASGGASGHHKC